MNGLQENLRKIHVDATKGLSPDQYIVYGSEKVYDAFDEFEHENTMDPFTIKPGNLDNILIEAMQVLQKEIDIKRKEFQHSGSFLAKVDKILDYRGKEVYTCEQ